MREFRTVYNAPCRTGKSSKPGYVPTRIDVAVCQVPTGTGKAMLHPCSKSSTGVACLGGVSRFHEFHLETSGFGLVLDKVLKLAEGPAMQPRPHPAPCLDMVPDVGEILHAEGGGPSLKGLRDDGFADLMVNMADMPLLPARDSLQLPFGSAAAVGLESAALGKVSIPVMPELAGDQKLLLKGSTGNADGSAARGGKEAEGLPLDRIRTVIKVDGGGREVERRDGLVLGDAFVGSKGLIGIGHPMDGLTDHLAAKGRKAFPHRVINQVVEGHAVPAAMLLNERNHGLASFGEEGRQNRERLRLLRRGEEFERAGSFHFAIFSSTRMRVKHPFLPALKDGVSWTNR